MRHCKCKKLATVKCLCTKQRALRSIATKINAYLTYTWPLGLKHTHPPTHTHTHTTHTPHTHTHHYHTHTHIHTGTPRVLLSCLQCLQVQACSNDWTSARVS